MAEKISYYFDEHMSRKVAEQLETRGCKVVMAADEGMVQKDDLTEHLTFVYSSQVIIKGKLPVLPAYQATSPAASITSVSAMSGFRFPL